MQNAQRADVVPVEQAYPAGKTLRVCILTERMRLGFGVDLVVDEQAKRLVKMGFDVVVVVIHADLAQPPRDYRLVVISRFMVPGDLTSEARMQQVLFRCGIDAVDLWLLHTPPFYDWVEYLPGPVVLIEYGAPPGMFFPPAIARQIDTMAQRRLTQLYTRLLPCDAVVSISHSIHNWLPEKVRPSSTVSHLGCDHYPLIASEDASTFRSTLGIDAEECLILWVGRMQVSNDEQPYKGFQELLALIPLVRRHVAHARFVLAGRVSDADRMWLTNSGITVLANLSAEEMALAYAAADFLVNLSQWEGFNLALLEAQFQGTPVVAYDLGPHPEIILHEKTGLLAKTPVQFFDAVIRMAGDRELRERLSVQARSFASQFTWDRNTAELVTIAMRCLKDAPSSADVIVEREDAFARAAYQSIGDTSDALTGQLDWRQYSGSDRLDWFRRRGRRMPDLLSTEEMQDDVFVEHAYWSLIDRRPEQADIEGWTGRLHSGTTRKEILGIIRMSEEGRLRKVTDLSIQRALTKPTQEKPSISVWKAWWDGVGDLTRIGSAFPYSPWFELDDAEFIRHAHRVLLNREAEQESVDGWVNLLRGGHRRQSILAAIRYSAEGKSRPLTDEHLRRILFIEGIRRSPLLRGLLPSPDPFEGGPEDDRRQLRRVDSNQRAIVADLHKIKTTLEQTSRDVDALRGLTDRRATLEAKLDNFGSGSAMPFLGAPVPLPSNIGTNLLRVGPKHVALVALGATLHSDTLAQLAEVARITESDILFGDEIEQLESDPSRKLRVKGPFSHDAFLNQPDLGSVIAVREDLLSRLGQSPTMALTGPAVLDIIALAHTVTYLPTVLGERTTGEIDAACPSRPNMEAYVAGIGRAARVEGDARAGFDVRFHAGSNWRVAIIIVSHDAEILQATQRSVAAKTEQARYSLDLLHISRERGSEYGVRINQAVRRMPSSCDLVMIMDGGVTPDSTDWLERLVESAIRPDVGIVAPKTLYADRRVRHAGLALGHGDPCGYVARFTRSGGSGLDGLDKTPQRLNTLSEVSFVSKHCMLIRRALFQDLGGIAEEFGREANDIELCCRVREAGLSVLLEGRVTMTQPDRLPRWARVLPGEELQALRARHGHMFVGDDPFWPSPQRAPAIDAPLVRATRTTRLPPLLDR